MKWVPYVAIREVTAKSILRKQKKIESWFLSSYGMNLYRGCAHNCVYCDGRSEKYQVDGEFGCDVTVKINAVDVLRRELESVKRRNPKPSGYIMVGGGVGDSYQPVEQTYHLTRKTLELLSNHGFPVHILTKSILVQRDIDLINNINEKNRALVSFSFSSVDDKISERFEPGVPPPSKRLETIATLTDKGIPCGMFLLPVIPFVTDSPQRIEESIQQASAHGVKFIVFGGMTLKEGRQMEHFYSVLDQYDHELLTEYNIIYRGDKWGNATKEYYDSIQKTFDLLRKKYHMPCRIPPPLYDDLLTENDRVIVILEHIDYLLKLQGRKSPYGYAAYSISKLPTPLSTMTHDLQQIKGVGRVTEKLIREILTTGRCSYYETLLFGR
jgi:DNA repair photolyase